MVVRNKNHVEWNGRIEIMMERKRKRKRKRKSHEIE